jgi:hypothetical protein
LHLTAHEKFALSLLSYCKSTNLRFLNEFLWFQSDVIRRKPESFPRIKVASHQVRPWPGPVLQQQRDFTLIAGEDRHQLCSRRKAPAARPAFSAEAFFGKGGPSIAAARVFNARERKNVIASHGNPDRSFDPTLSDVCGWHAEIWCLRSPHPDVF